MRAKLFYKVVLVLHGVVGIQQYSHVEVFLVRREDAEISMLGSLEYLLPSSFFLKENLKSSISKTHTLVVSLSQWVLNFYLFFFYGKSFSTIFFFFLVEKVFCSRESIPYQKLFQFDKGNEIFQYRSTSVYRCEIITIFTILYNIQSYITLVTFYISGVINI